MDFVLDISVLETIVSENFFVLTLKIFQNGGFIVLIFILLKMMWRLWLRFVRTRYAAKWRFVLLQVDIPKMHEQTPRAVENIFSHLAGASKGLTWIERNWDGELPNFFSLEIISVEGNIQFLIYTIAKLRDLAEAAVYAQYPDAEIKEVSDYTAAAPQRFPDAKYNIYGTEIFLSAPECYPIRTYPQFEDRLTQEMKDPMAGIMETLSRLGSGEQIWLQTVITPPEKQDWIEAGKREINKIIGAKTPSKKTFLEIIFNVPLQILDMLMAGIIPPPPAVKKTEEPLSKMLFLSQREREIAETIGYKINKVGLHTKIRFIYLAKHEVFNRGKITSAIYGAYQQFRTLHCNSLRPELSRVITRARYVFKKTRLAWRQNNLIKAYCQRSNWRGTAGLGNILNVEELATIWHFPMPTVKAPLIQKVESKRGGAPSTLPLAEETIEEDVAGPEEAEKATAPPNLPVV